MLWLGLQWLNLGGYFVKYVFENRLLNNDSHANALWPVNCPMNKGGGCWVITAYHLKHILTMFLNFQIKSICLKDGQVLWWYPREVWVSECFAEWNAFSSCHKKRAVSELWAGSTFKWDYGKVWLFTLFLLCY